MDIESFRSLSQDLIEEEIRKAKNREAQRNSRRKRAQQKPQQRDDTITLGSPSTGFSLPMLPNTTGQDPDETHAFDFPLSNENVNSLASVYEDLATEIQTNAGNNSMPLRQMGERGGFGTTAFHIAAEQGHLGLVKLMVHCGMNISVQDGNGQTALHLSIKNGHAETAMFSIEHGASVEAVDIRGWTALHLAAHAGLEAVAFRLIQYGADIHTRAEHS